MSVNRALNAVIAFLEDRPAQFKELLRSPDSNVTNLSVVGCRLRAAVNQYAATQVRGGLMSALHVEPPNSVQDTTAFFEGVRAAEEVFETLAQKLERAL